MARALTGRQDSSEPIGDGTKAGICVLGARCLTWNGRKVTGTRRDAPRWSGLSRREHYVHWCEIVLGPTWHRDRESARSQPSGLAIGMRGTGDRGRVLADRSLREENPDGDGRRWGGGRCPFETSCPRGCSRSATSGTGPAKRLAAAVGEGPVSVRSPASTSRSLTERISSALTSGRSPMSQTWRSISAGWRNPLVRPHPCGGPRPGWLPA
jgi:hypothetical protein